MHLGKLTEAKAVYDTVYILIAVTGLISSLARGSNQCAIAHKVYETARFVYPKEAHDKLHDILVSDVAIPEPMLYFIFGDLEICCKQMEDFKGAYEYSINKVGLLQKLLT